MNIRSYIIHSKDLFSSDLMPSIDILMLALVGKYLAMRLSRSRDCVVAIQEAGIASWRFGPIGENWSSVYFRKKLKYLSMIYVDDLKMIGPTQNLKEDWSLLLQIIEIESEEDSGLYLGWEIHSMGLRR